MSERDLMEAFVRLQEKGLEAQERQERIRERTMHGLTFKLRATRVRSLLVKGRESTQRDLEHLEEELGEARAAALCLLECEDDEVHGGLNLGIDPLQATHGPYGALPPQDPVEALERACDLLRQKIETIEVIESTIDNDAAIFEVQYEQVYFLNGLARNEDPASYMAMGPGGRRFGVTAGPVGQRKSKIKPNGKIVSKRVTK
jgi:hypothetical protein